jgi:hypothetical protein
MSILDTRAKPTPSASSRGVAGRTINLDTVSGDIHHLIFSDLLNSSSADLLNVAQSSKTLRDAALPYIYRNIILNGASDESGTRTAYQALVGRLQNDAPGQLTRHIRSITVKNEVPSEDLITILQKTSRHINFRLIKYILLSVSQVTWLTPVVGRLPRTCLLQYTTCSTQPGQSPRYVLFVGTA